MSEKINVEMGRPNCNPVMRALSTLIGMYCAHDSEMADKLRAHDGAFEIEMKINGAEIRFSKVIELINSFSRT